MIISAPTNPPATGKIKNENSTAPPKSSGRKNLEAVHAGTGGESDGNNGEEETKMSELKKAYPLQWPPAKPQTKPGERKTNSSFKTSFADARHNCGRQIKLLGGSDLIISTNIPLNRHGLPGHIDWGKQISGHPGVAVYFKRKGKELCFACDAWNHVQDNMHAVALTIEALRGISRWGTGDMMEAAFRGFAALPAPGQSGGMDPWKILGLPLNANKDELTEAFRALAKKFHPDNTQTGDQAEFLRIRQAYDLIAKNLKP
jgi:hypothetical protein